MTCNTSLSHAGMVFRLDIDRSMSPLQVTIIKLNSGYYTDTFIISQNFNQNNMERRGQENYVAGCPRKNDIVKIKYIKIHYAVWENEKFI